MRLVTLLLAVVTATGLAVAPLGTSTSCSASSDAPTRVCTREQTSLVRSDGRGVVVVLLIPALIALGPVVLPRSRRAAFVAAGALSAFLVLGLMTIGVFFAPVVVLAWIAAARSPKASPAAAA